MQIWITVEQQLLTLSRSLFVCLGLLDGKGELACNATFLCGESFLPTHLSPTDSPLAEQSYLN